MDTVVNVYALAFAEEAGHLPPNIAAIPVGTLVGLAEYITPPSQGFEAAAQDFAWLSEQALRHDSMLKGFAAQMPILPFRMGTFFSSIEKAGEALASMQTHGEQRLKYLADKEEWSVKVYVSPLRPAPQHPDLEALEAELAQASPGKAFFLKKKTEAFMAQIAEQVLQELAQQVRHIAEGLSVQLREGALHGKQLTGRTDDMLLNLSCLLPKFQAEALQARLSALETPGICIACTGPWPPYSFAEYE